MLCVNVDKLAQGVARDPGIEQRNAKSYELMMVAGTAGASGVNLMLPKCQLLFFFGRKSVEEGMPSLYCVGPSNAMMQIKVAPVG